MVIYHRRVKAKMQGSAIVFALGITSLVVILATSMIMSLRTDIRLVEKLETMIRRQSWILASEATAKHMLSIKEKQASVERSFVVESEGVEISGVLLDLPKHGVALDKKIPVKGQLALLHTTVEGETPIEVYSLFKKQDKAWHLVYRSHGARE